MSCIMFGRDSYFSRVKIWIEHDSKESSVEQSSGLGKVAEAYGNSTASEQGWNKAIPRLS